LNWSRIIEAIENVWAHPPTPELLATPERLLTQLAGSSEISGRQRADRGIREALEDSSRASAEKPKRQPNSCLLRFDRIDLLPASGNSI
jgi:hypothetical protein